MIKATQFIFFMIFFSTTSINGQNIPNLLMEKKWSAFENFAIIDFQDNGKAILEYAYCTYCRGNLDTIAWSMNDSILYLGKDTLNILDVEEDQITTHQYGQAFIFKAINKIEASELSKEEIHQFLVTEKPLGVLFNNGESDLSQVKEVQFSANGQMWLGEPQYRGQWIIKYFYGSPFLIYLNRYTVNRDFPLIKINTLKKGKLTGQPIPSITKGAPFVLEIFQR